MRDLTLRCERAQPLGRVRAFEEPADDLLALLRPHAFQKQQRPAPRDGVLRIRKDPQMGEEIFDVGALYELKAAALHKRDVVARELYFQIERMEARAEENGDIPERHPFFS